MFQYHSVNCSLKLLYFVFNETWPVWLSWLYISSEGISSRIRALCDGCSSGLLARFTSLLLLRPTTSKLKSNDASGLSSDHRWRHTTCEVSQITICWRGILKSFIDSFNEYYWNISRMMFFNDAPFIGDYLGFCFSWYFSKLAATQESK